MVTSGIAHRNVTWIERARALAPLIEGLAPRIEAMRELPPELLAALHEKQLFVAPHNGAIGQYDGATHNWSSIPLPSIG